MMKVMVTALPPSRCRRGTRWYCTREPGPLNTVPAAFSDTFASNPQYTVQLEDPDVDDDDDLCTMVVSLMQKNVRQLKRYGVDYVPIGFTIYKLPPDVQPGKKLDTEFFKYNPSIAKVPFFLNTREITTRFRFPPGFYVIIPSTFEPEMTGEFLLRVFTEAKRK